jgi:DNA-binding response OmpR family regulator
MGSFGKPLLPGQKATGWHTRNPKLPEGFTKTSAEGRLLVYFQENPGRICSETDLMTQTGIQSLNTLRKAVSELRAVITQKIIRLSDGYIFE